MKLSFIDRLSQRVLLCDGGTGTLIQAQVWDVERDFLGLENCSEILVVTRPDFVASMHRAYFEAGADCVETNTFGANKVVLAEFGLEARAYELNVTAARIARQLADEYTTPAWPRYVLGSIGPGTKLPSIGHITYDVLEDSYHEQALGLIDGGVDCFLLETNQDLLTIKAAINACKAARLERGQHIPIIVQVTIETTGTMLVGSDIGCACAVLDAMDVEGIGLNCATGPAEMAEHVRYLSENWLGMISVMPNAGLPMLVDGKTEYPLLPFELAEWQQRFVTEDGINLIGGCCGTSPEHIRALRAMLDARVEPAPVSRSGSRIAAVASLYSAVPLRQENALFSIGERSNANGSKRFRDLLNEENWEALTAIGREQVQEGSHALDVCAAYVGRVEHLDMQQIVTRYRGQIAVPLVIDSTELLVIESALKLIGGKAVINSINFEDGEERPHRVLDLAKKFGAAVIALTIDEAGMAKEVADKLRVARRLYDFAVHQHGLPPTDLIFDPLTFTICTGVEEDREHGIKTLDAIEALAQAFPESQIILGLSNISFGLNPAARHVLNSVFLHHARRRGMTGAIVHVSKIMPLHQIEAEHLQAAEDLIFNHRRDGRDPLLYFVELFRDAQVAAYQRKRPDTIEDILKQRIIDGDKQGLEEDLHAAMQRYAPLDIINDLLLDGMRVVGERFGSGEMQLPFVLQSAETMKAAVGYLEPFMEKIGGSHKGVLVLATVKGDVHDIGKNLVDIILTNNGYKVVNLGIKQPIASIMEAAQQYGADAIGMSGLLVKSTVIMKENLQYLSQVGVHTPVILGGAALTRRYVETDCRSVYSAPDQVHYAKDAFAGLGLMDEIMLKKQQG